MIQLAWPWLSLALPLPWLLRAVLRPAQREAGAAIYAPFIEALTVHNTHRSEHPSRAMTLLASLLWLLLVLAAVRPQWLGEAIELPQTGRSLMLAVDTSGSMEANDLDENYTRLDVVKQVASEFIERRRGDQLGLILFGSQAYIQTPLTFDRSTVARLLNESVIGIAGKATAIGDAIGLAIKRLNKHGRKGRKTPASGDDKTSPQQAVLILLTDGSNTAGSVAPLQAARLAAEAGIRIYTIGVGANQVQVRGWFGLRNLNPAAELDEPTLKAIAQATGGRYFRATDKRSLANIYVELDRLEPGASEQQIVRPIEELYIWPLAAAVLLSLLVALASTLREPLKRLSTRPSGNAS